MKCIVVAISMCVALASCGGGSDSSPLVVSTESFPVRAAYIKLMQSAESRPFTLVGQVSDIQLTGEGTITSGDLFDTTFEGAVALGKTSAITSTLSIEGKTYPSSSTSTIYLDSKYNPIGMIGKEYSVVTSSTPLPEKAKVGATGIWLNINTYTNFSKTSLLEIETVTYVLEPETASTALLRTIQVSKKIGSATTTTIFQIQRITPSGNLTELSRRFEDGTQSFTMTF